MSTEALIALFSGTGIATVLGILYQVWKERRGNEQRDIAGDLTLGELFRAAAKREVADAYMQLDQMRAKLSEYANMLAEHQRRIDEQTAALRVMEAKYRGAQDYVQVLVREWRSIMGEEHPIPEAPDEYFPDSRKFKGP